MPDSLPATMVARLHGLGAALVRWAAAHPGATLAEQEAAVLGQVRRSMAALLREVLTLTTPALRGAAGPWPRCPGCATRTPVQSWRPRTVQTVCGVVTFVRPWHVCRHCHHGFSPADASLALDQRTRLSAGLHGWLVELGATTSFREAARLLQALTGRAVAAETLRRHTEAEGAAQEAAQQQAITTVAAAQEAAAALDPAPGRLVVEVDGVMVRYRDGRHEVKVGVLAGRQDGALHAPSQVAAREAPPQSGPRLLTEAARRGALTVADRTGPVGGRGLAVRRPVVALGDGAARIWQLAADHFGGRTEIVDFYHASEHLWTVARARFGTGTPATTARAATQRRRPHDERATPIRAALAALQSTAAEGCEVLRPERGYVATHAARMDYPTFRAAGLPIGSGAVESSARHLVQQRLKRAGCRRSPAGAQALLTLRASRASHLPLAA